ncbi:MAG: hypothetical protein JRH01_16400 [Deltaproteobacteria bacterium]|nr:hypothetical protein [Deltaproteobacteria bacterium]
MDRCETNRLALALPVVGSRPRWVPLYTDVQDVPARSQRGFGVEALIFGEKTRVRARIHTITRCSAHAVQVELRAWHEHAAPATASRVRGDPEALSHSARL